MFCEIADQFGFFALWGSMTLLGLISMMILSSSVFVPLYSSPKFSTWQYKSNPKFPSALLVKKEIVHTIMGLVPATLIPAYTLVASLNGGEIFGGALGEGFARSKGYCGDPHTIGWSGFLLQTAVIFSFTDFVEYCYHYLGHRFSLFWRIHRHHHSFFNPTPFAVIADEWPDQFCRTLPMLALPLMMPINMDLLFFIFASLFYGYGVYLHSGYELPFLSAHNPIFNTSYHHYHHHAVSIIGKPIYTGFFFKIWDYLFDTAETAPCKCHSCRPARSEKMWENEPKPDYSVLLSPTWWVNSSIAGTKD